MSAPQSFGVAVRVVGLLVMLYGLYALLSVVLMIVMVGADVLPVKLPLISAVVAMLLGYYLLQGGGLVQRLAYGDGRTVDN